MKIIVPGLLILLMAGCSPSVQTQADGTPYITITARDVAPPIEIVTNAIFETVMTAQENTNGMAVVTITTHDQPGMTGMCFKLTPPAIKKLHALHHQVVTRAFEGLPHSARGEILVGTNVVYDSNDFRGTPGAWVASGEMTLNFQSPDLAQQVADTLSGK